MNNQDVFNTPEQEAAVLIKEIGEIKEVLRELSRKLSRIESRASRAFPSVARKSIGRPKGKNSEVSSDPTMTVDEVMRLYDEMVDLAKGGKTENIHERLGSLELSNLNFLRSELGVSLGKKKPSRRILIEAVMGRIRESVMLTKHIDRNQLVDQNESTDPKPDRPEEEQL